MNRFYRRPFFVTIVMFAVLCVILALCVSWTASDLLVILILPFQRIGTWIRESVLNGNAFGGWCVYLLIGLLPLIVPAVKTARIKRFYPISLLWIVLSGFLFVMLYFYINPHLLDTTVFAEISEEGTEYLRQGTMIGMQVTFIVILLICILCEFGSRLGQKPENAYLLAKWILLLYALGVVFTSCFLGVLAAKINWNALAVSPELSDIVRLNDGLNKFAILLSVIADLIPSVVTVILLMHCAALIDRLKIDAFAPSNIGPLNGVIRLTKLSVLITLGAAAVNNIIQLCLSRYLLHASYAIEIPLVSLFAICLVLIFAQILKRAILINEENRLTI